MAYKVTLLIAEVYILYKANKALSKYQRAKKNYIRQGGILTIEDIYNILAQEEVDKQIQYNKYSRRAGQNKGQSSIYYCRNCRKTGYNI